MAYTAIICRLTNVRPHPNGDYLKLAEAAGSHIIVGLEKQEGDLGILFPTDGQLSVEFCKNNNLFRDSSKNKDTSKKGLFDDNRRVKTQKIRGEKSDGFWIEIESIGYTGHIAQEGDEFCELSGFKICDKYISKETRNALAKKANQPKAVKENIIMFKEHFDTPQFDRNFRSIKLNDELVITEKLHGTSQRNANVKVRRVLSLKEKIAKWLGLNVNETHYIHLAGTRRVVLNKPTTKSFHDPSIREYANNLFDGQLHKGETVYSEIVGYENDKPIMSPCDIKLLKDKEFEKTWKSKVVDDKMIFSYGTQFGECDVYVYRITFTNEDGVQYDYSWDDVVERCKELGVKAVPVLWRGKISDLPNESTDDRDIYTPFRDLVTTLSSGRSLLDDKHIKEGVIISVQGRGFTPEVYKYKSFEFKVLEGIIKDSGVLDEEESN